MSIDVEIAGHNISLSQSPGLLNSNRDTGTTGAVLWKISPLVANWLVRTNILWSTNILRSDATVVELGCGITGLIGLCLAPLVSKYLLTDQRYVMKALQENISGNQLVGGPGPRVRRKHRGQGTFSSKLLTLPFDWEKDSISNVHQALQPNRHIDLLLACDCIYNDFLIGPLMETCLQLCQAGAIEDRQTVLLIAQQLRSDAIFEAWLQVALQSFHIWRLPDEALSDELKSGSGYVIHLGVLRNSTSNTVSEDLR